jgi:selenocysteine-specific elongation factor
MAHIVVGTAGHIDHGKTSLVKALTGMDTDTLREERERAITIDLGFAFLGEDVTIIDVPGHERFIKNMVSGVATIDFVLFVIAADDGIMPQSREHLDILRLLGLKRGLVVLSKADLVDAEWLELVEDEIRGFVAGSFLEGAPILAVDSLSGRGIAALKDELAARLAELPPRDGRGVFRESVDRAFSIKGHGTVITGTVLGGRAAVGEELEIQPGGHRARVRQLQVHGRTVEAVRQGDRAAVNLQGITPEQTPRGSTLCAPGTLKASSLLDVRLQLLPSAKRLRHRERLRLHIGTAECIGRAILLGRTALEPGEEAFAQLRLEEPVAALVGDRFVLRQYSPQRTVGGGEVVDPDPARHRPSSRGVVERLSRIAVDEEGERLAGLIDDPRQPLWTEEALREKTGARLEELTRPLEALREAGEVEGLELGSRRRWISKRNLDRLRAGLLARIEAWHREAPEQPGMKSAQLRSELFAAGSWSGQEQGVLDELLKRLAAEGRVAASGGLVALNGHEVRVPAELRQRMERLEELLDAAAYSAPRPAELAAQLKVSPAELRRVLALCRNEGRVEAAGDEILLSRRRFDEALNLLAGLDDKDGEGFTVSQAGTALGGAPRRFTVPFLEALDERGITVRNGNFRHLHPGHQGR